MVAVADAGDHRYRPGAVAIAVTTCTLSKE